MRIHIHLFYPLSYTGSNGPCQWSRIHVDTELEEHIVWLAIFQFYKIPALIKRFKPVKWHLSICYTSVLLEFFWWLGRQNDYLYPPKGSTTEGYPFKSPHVWKTRFGIAQSWEIAKAVINAKSN